MNMIGVILCIYVLISKKYKTDSTAITLIFLCLNIIFMCRLWLYLDPNFILTATYIFTNIFNFIILFLTMVKVRKNIVLDKRNITKRLRSILDPVISKYNKLVSKIFNKQNKI